MNVTWSDERMVEVIGKWRHFKWRSLGEKWPSLLRNDDQMVEAIVPCWQTPTKHWFCNNVIMSIYHVISFFFPSFFFIQDYCLLLSKTCQSFCYVLHYFIQEQQGSTLISNAVNCNIYRLSFRTHFIQLYWLHDVATYFDVKSRKMPQSKAVKWVAKKG